MCSADAVVDDLLDELPEEVADELLDELIAELNDELIDELIDELDTAPVALETLLEVASAVVALSPPPEHALTNKHKMVA